MRIKQFRKYLEGGPVEPQEEVPVENAPVEGQPTSGQDPLMQILQVAQQALLELNCEAAMAVCLALLQLAQGGGQPAPAEEPTYARRGARLVRIR